DERSETVKKVFAVVLGLALIGSAWVGATEMLGARADSPHFITSGANVSGTSLVTSFKEVGLGTTATSETISASASATAVYGCFNNGGNHPQAANKETVNGTVSNSGSFPVRNGQTTGSLTLSAPGPGAFSCPSGQSLRLISVCYSSVVIRDLTSGASATV